CARTRGWMLWYFDYW
nr:immunoglobulin heavy chain junction region [Macaca mulatta]